MDLINKIKEWIKDKLNRKKEKIKKANLDLIEKTLKKFNDPKLEKPINENLSSYRSEALRHVHYYGNLRLKYVGLNITLFTIFFAYIGTYLNLGISLGIFDIDPFNPNWWGITITVLSPLIIYLISCVVLIIKKSYTISFDHSNLSHYYGFVKNYPKLTKDECDKFLGLIKKKKEELRNDDLKTLYQYYFYQANFDKAGERGRRYLYWGIFLFIVEIVISLGFIIDLIMKIA